MAFCDHRVTVAERLTYLVKIIAIEAEIPLFHIMKALR